MNKLNVEMEMPMALFTKTMVDMRKDYGKVANDLYEAIRKQVHKAIIRSNTRELEIIVMCKGFNGVKMVFNYDLEVYGK